MHVFLLISAALISASAAQQPCVSRDYGEDSVVCVCNATYCDVAEPTTSDQIEGGNFRHYETNKAGKRLEPMSMMFNMEKSSAADGIVINVQKDTTYQKMLGFGGAMTDAAGINIRSLSEDARDLLLSQYFAPEGARYSFIRVPIGGSDFSTHYYSYENDTVDDTLENFNLTAEDFVYKIPLIKRAQELSADAKIKLFGSAWSAPDWMKNITDEGKHSRLLPEYYQLWADYHVKFLDSYGEQGLEFWGVTTQNEPFHGRDMNTAFNSMGWTVEQQRDWLVGNLGPTLKDNEKYSDLVIMILDDNRQYAKQWAEEIFGNDTSNEWTPGMAVHWYNDNGVPATDYDEIHNNFSDKFLLSTEACVGVGSNGPQLGSWGQGQQYISDIIQVTNHWVSGWVDWNLALDLQGGPNWVRNYVNSPIIVNATADEFYKQPLYYALAHVSMFVPEDSVRIGLDVQSADEVEGLECVAFTTPDDVNVIIIHNKNENDVPLTLSDPDRGDADLTISADSINTILYK